MAKRGNPGYGKMENIRLNVDKFMPKFWELMEEFANSPRKDDKKFFIQEFNKIQTKMIPQNMDLTSGGKPIPILSPLNVHPHDGDQENIPTEQENTSDSGRDSGQQDDINATVIDSPSTERLETDADIDSLRIFPAPEAGSDAGLPPDNGTAPVL